MKLFRASLTKQDSFSVPLSLVPVWEENRIFVYPNKSIVPDYLVHDFFFNFGGSAIYFLPIGDYILVELWQVLIYG